MAVITAVEGSILPDSRGVPTLEVTVHAGSASGTCRVPSGKSRGEHEAHELRDPDGGVTEAHALLVGEIADALRGMPLEQQHIDEALIALDGTSDKSRLGGNTTIGVSEAVARAIAEVRGVPLWRSIADALNSEPTFPKLYMNIINGGVHADFRLPFQEYMVVLDGEPGETYALGQELFAKLGETIHTRFGAVPLGDEGGYAPECRTIDEPFELLTELIAGSSRVTLAIDAAASELWTGSVYTLGTEARTTEALTALYTRLVHTFPLRSIEDPFEQNDVTAFSQLTTSLGDVALIVGDDLTVTNPSRIKDCIAQHAASALIIKPNQIGTVSETYAVLQSARAAGWKHIVSHRSGDTMDSFVADLAVGSGAYGLKAGSPHPPERKVKYERLVEIAQREMIR